MSSADKLYKKIDKRYDNHVVGPDLDPNCLTFYDNLSKEFRNRSDRTLYTDCN